jgi:hypothetical protein
MELQYKGCDIYIKLLSIKDGEIGYEYSITTYKMNQPEDHPFAGKTKYTNHKDTIRHIYMKAQEWIDNHL